MDLAGREVCRRLRMVGLAAPASAATGTAHFLIIQRDNPAATVVAGTYSGKGTISSHTATACSHQPTSSIVIINATGTTTLP